MYDNITETVGCSTSNDSLACLRTVPYDALYNACIGFRQTPIMDGEFISQLPSQSIQKGEIADVSIIMGTNTDEGTAIFLGPRANPLNTDEDVFKYVQALGSGLDNKTVETVMKLYPDDPTWGCPFGTGPERFADQGFQYKRGAAIAGDYFMHAGRRFYSNSHSTRSRKPIYTYRFDQAPWDMREPSIMIVPPVYVTHFSEVLTKYCDFCISSLIIHHRLCMCLTTPITTVTSLALTQAMRGCSPSCHDPGLHLFMISILITMDSKIRISQNGQSIIRSSLKTLYSVKEGVFLRTTITGNHSWRFGALSGQNFRPEGGLFHWKQMLSRFLLTIHNAYGNIYINISINQYVQKNVSK